MANALKGKTITTTTAILPNEEVAEKFLDPEALDNHFEFIRIHEILDPVQLIASSISDDVSVLSGYGNAVYWINEDGIQESTCDSGQVVFHSSEWKPWEVSRGLNKKLYPADHRFYQNAYIENEDNFYISDHLATFYNRLKW